jgi:SNF2 family DNA or RNA helicase|tara:strand:+ start:319 stop:1887 length:1569 start_codon:yes stop_codon:yes gene_type:complete
VELINNKALKITVPNDIVDRITEAVKKTKILQARENLTDLLIHWGPDELTQLNSIATFKKSLPSPITKDYKYTGRWSPFAHQKITSEFLSINKKGFCFNEAGTGKTSSVLWASDYLMNLGIIKRVLVICPLSIMTSAWKNDIYNTCIHRTPGIAYGTAADRRAIINNTRYEFVIINYDGVRIVKDDIIEANFDLIVVDEANAYKNVSTTRWKTLNKILKPHTRLWMLTGTPASQSPVDAYGLARLVAPHKVPKFSSAWRDRVMNQITRFKWVPKINSEETVYKVLQPAIRFAKNDCLDLPPVTYQTREVPLTKNVQKYYKELKKEFLIEAAGEEVSAVNAAAKMTKLLQISGGAVYTDNKKVIEFDVSPRLNALMEVVGETSNKILIFVPYRHTIDIVAKHLEEKGITTAIINGSVSAHNRTQIIKEFQNADDPRALVIQPQSAAHGVTLTRADTVVFWSPVMSVEVYLQCIARIDRVGQKNIMTVVHLQGSEIERRLYAMLQGKVDTHMNLVDLYNEEIGL